MLTRTGRNLVRRGVPTGLPTKANRRVHVWTWDFISDATVRGTLPSPALEHGSAFENGNLAFDAPHLPLAQVLRRIVDCPLANICLRAFMLGRK